MKASVYLLCILGTSVLLSTYSAVLGAKEIAVSDTITGAWFFFFTVLVMFWAHSDAAKQREHRTLDFGFYFFIMWPIMLPYYLVKTRGIEGLVYFTGFVALYAAPFLFGLVSYVYITAA